MWSLAEDSGTLWLITRREGLYSASSPKSRNPGIQNSCL